MSQIPNELKDGFPSFEHGDKKSDEAPIDFSALSSFRGARSLRGIATLLGIFAVVFFLLQGILVWSAHTELRLSDADRYGKGVRAELQL